MTNSEQPADDLARRLEWATSSQPPPADLDGDAAQWREAWQAFGSRLEAEQPSLDTSALLAKLRAQLEPAAPAPGGHVPSGGIAAAEGPPGRHWWLAIAVAIAAAITGGWWAVRQYTVTIDAVPSGAPLATGKETPSSEKISPAEKPSPANVVELPKPKQEAPAPVVPPSSAELALTAWDDNEVDQALTQVKTQVYGTAAEWQESRFDHLDEQLQELEEQMDEDGSL